MGERKGERVRERSRRARWREGGRLRGQQKETDPYDGIPLKNQYISYQIVRLIFWQLNYYYYL